jgi:glycosyltransferase involved in cell wall biosynthesis
LTSRFLGVTASQIYFLSTVRKYPAAKIHIIRSGVDVKDFENHVELDLSAKLGAEPGRPIVAMVARLHPVKDHVTFLSAARIVLDSLPRTQFVIIGDGPERAALEKLCGALDLALNVHFVGTCTDIDQMLPAVDVHVLSSHSESLPLAVLEGMACGKPVICTDVGGTSQTIEHGISGFLVPPRDPVLLANHLMTLLTNPVLAEQMGAAGKRRVETDFSLVKSVAEVENFIGELVRSNEKIGTQLTQP